MDIDAETHAVIFERPGLVRMIMNVSNPASSSYLRFTNLATDILRVGVVMERGVPRTSFDTHASVAVGNHDIAPNRWYDVTFSIPDGSDAGSNVWSTRFGLGPSEGGAGLPTLNLRVMVVNGPGGSPGTPGDNWVTVQVETL